MQLKTRDFGEIEVKDGDIIHFESPIFGFDEYLNYALISSDEMPGIMWLQSVEESGLCFIVAEPSLVKPDYAPKLPDEVKFKLGEGECFQLLMVVIRDDFKKSTANLKSPLVINQSSHKAVQVILEEALPIRYPLVKERAGA